jgi:hypothetical protein
MRVLIDMSTTLPPQQIAATASASSSLLAVTNGEVMNKQFLVYAVSAWPRVCFNQTPGMLLQ